MKNKEWGKFYASAHLNFGEIQSAMYFWFINLVVKPLKGVNFDVAVWEERKWQWHILGVELKLFRRGWSGLHRGMDCKLYHV